MFDTYLPTMKKCHQQIELRKRDLAYCAVLFYLSFEFTFIK